VKRLRFRLYCWLRSRLQRPRSIRHTVLARIGAPVHVSLTHPYAVSYAPRRFSRPSPTRGVFRNGRLDASPEVVGLDVGLDLLVVVLQNADLPQSTLVPIELGPVVLEQYPALVPFDSVDKNEAGHDVLLQGGVGSSKCSR